MALAPESGAGSTAGGAALDLLAVVGPTAAGKSALAIELASRLGGEIVNADSMQLYRGMDIGTAKVPPAERHGVPHHLLDIWDVDEPADVARYAGLARCAIAGIRARGNLPLLVGGSGLYLSAVLDGFRFPGTDPTVRARLETELAAHGAQALHDRLAEVAPEAAASILASNGRRLVRALEVVELTGGVQAVLPRPQARDGLVVLGIDTSEPAALDARIEQRVIAMFDGGLPGEVRALLDAGLRRGRTASRALGYRQVMQWWDGLLADEAECRAMTVRATRRFARRQRSWFCRDPRVRWLRFTDLAGSDAAAVPALLKAALAELAAGHTSVAAAIPRE